jgi:hypothetical protein
VNFVITAARPAGRSLGQPVRTMVSADGATVFAFLNRQVEPGEQAESAPSPAATSPGFALAAAVADLHEATDRFWREYRRLTAERRAAFRRAVQHFVVDLGEGQFRAGLRVKGIVGMPGCFEITGPPTGERSSRTGRRPARATSTSFGRDPWSVLAGLAGRSEQQGRRVCVRWRSPRSR